MAHMTIVYMTHIGGKGAHRHSETLTSPGVGAAIIIPYDIRNITIQFTQKINGYGILQATLDTVEEIIADTADWVTWDFGDVSDAIQTSAFPVTAIRQTNYGNTTKLTVLAQ